MHTVDGFQGREKEAVIISFTRSNDSGEYGFLREQRRTNVAVTRARRHLCLIGNSDTVSHEPFIKGMVETCHSNGEVWSAHDYMQAPDFEVFHFHQPRASTDEIGKKSVVTRNEGVPRPKSIARRGSKPITSTVSLPLRSEPDKPQIELQGTICHFMEKSDLNVLSFPASLTGNERRIIHQLCEQFGLLHESKGLGKERFIEVRKPKEKNAVGIGAQQEESDVGMTHEHISHETDKPCAICGTDVPLVTWDLHHVHCAKKEERSEVEPKKSEEAAESTETAKRPKNVARKKSSKPQKVNQLEDLDALLAEVKLADCTCKFPHCSKQVNLLGILCQFCKNRFCMEHSLAEVHGCGTAARQQSRKDLQQEAKQGGSKLYCLTGAKRSLLQTKLAQKLEEKSTSRLSKADSKRKKDIGVYTYVCLLVGCFAARFHVTLK